MLSANQHLLESIVSRILSSTLSLSAVIVTTVDDRVFRICVLRATHPHLFMHSANALHTWAISMGA